jgi:hypothetical protein
VLPLGSLRNAFFLSLLVMPAIPLGQALGKLREPFDDLSAAITSAYYKLSSDTAASASLKRSGDLTDDLLQRWQSANRPDLPATYIASLSLNTGFVREAIQTGDTGVRHALLRDVENDLELKTLFTSVFGAAGGFAAQVQVEVSTVKGGATVSGYSVQANRKRLPERVPPFLEFGRLTSPATEELPPGNYVIRILDAKGVLAATKDHTVTGRGGKKEVVQVVIP